MQLGERKKRILSAVVNTYIRTGEPVGSRLLTGTPGLRLSSATIRNEMSELAEMGYLEQPHTSAGRIPSQMGYRFYVDSLMEAYRLTKEEKERIDSLLAMEGADLESLLEKSGELLASITGCAAVSAAPVDKTVRVRRVELVPASRRTALLVVLASSGALRSRLCRCEEEITTDMIAFFSRLVNDNISGRQLAEISPATFQELTGELYEYTCALGPILGALSEEIMALHHSEVFVGGETNLLSHPDYDGQKVLRMIRFLQQREELIRLIEGVEKGLCVRIGTENGTEPMEASSMIAAPVLYHGRATGAIGIIGPTRMNYSRLVSHIEYFSSLLSRIISETFFDE